MCIPVVVVIIIVGIVIGAAIIKRYRIIIGSTSIVGRIGSIGVKRLAGIGCPGIAIINIGYLMVNDFAEKIFNSLNVSDKSSVGDEHKFFVAASIHSSRSSF